ncbi:NfeD family protein [Bacillus taeanensis]|uniref:Nodulation protein NfeD n=1 Tax=Bacillus taeanensis TaxID=273032 RepID=A0A366Y265_9BACI|nr:nodulation protein NfeD [Bacillus taeanensis]RBW70503.1 nodulation protein NfeD [Bacillus taeanensis]
MYRYRKGISFLFTIISFAAVFIASTAYGEGEGKLVYFIPVEQEVERGLEAFLQRGIDEAGEEGADHIVLEINTPGGAVNAADNIADLLRQTNIPITAFVTKKALSAGAYIALNTDQIVMKPGSTMGSAAIIDQSGNTAGKKAESYWLAEMKASAELNNRDPKYAMAMANPDIDLPEYGAGKGELLTLTADQALKVGYAEKIVEDRTALLSYLKLTDAVTKEIDISFAEKLARFVTNPVIVPILLSIGSLGLVLELYSPGFGIPGIMGAVALLLFFFGHMIAGFAGWEALLLLAAGIILILIEIFTPGGIFGILGAIAVVASIVLASGTSLQYSLLSILIAIVITVIGSVIFIKIFGYKGFLRKIILFDATKTEQGYVASVTREDIIGLEGETMTPLRPSGTAVFNEERLDVVTEGNYIAANKKIKIVKTNGSRVVVREITTNNQSE